MHLRRHERGVGDLVFLQPVPECRRIPAFAELAESAARGEGPRRHAEAADMVRRQHKPPAGRRA